MKKVMPGEVALPDGGAPEPGGPAAAGRRPTRINSVDRAARVLLHIASNPNAGWKARSLAQAMNTTLPTMYHLLNTLSDCGFVSSDEHGVYRLGISIAKLAASYQEQAVPASELLAPLREIAERTGEGAYLSDWRNGEMEVITHVPGTLPVRVIDLRAGFRGVAHARAAGKVLLAFGAKERREHYLATSDLDRLTAHTVTDRDDLRKELEKVWENGFGVELEEFADGVGCLSVPIMTAAGLLGAYTVSAPIDRLLARQSKYLATLQESAMRAAGAGEATGAGQESNAGR